MPPSLHWLTALVGWLYANVLGNLVASAICAVPAAAGMVWHHRRIKAHITDQVQHLIHHHQQRTGETGGGDPPCPPA